MTGIERQEVPAGRVEQQSAAQDPAGASLARWSAQ
jgi:hypothetical protein